VSWAVIVAAEVAPAIADPAVMKPVVTAVTVKVVVEMEPVKVGVTSEYPGLM